jgi:rhomboid family GlyGly-CTERM serine protease
MLSTTLKSYIPYLLLLMLSAVLYVLPASLQQCLEYQADAIRHGQIWRLLSGHLLHSNLLHLLLNLLGLVVLMLLHGKLPGRLAVGWQILLLSLSTGVALFFLAPEIAIYVGLSGVLHGLLCYGATADLRQGYHSGALILVGVAIKVGSEQWQGPDPELSAQIAAEVAIDAHLYGAVSGVLLALLSWRYIKRL